MHDKFNISMQNTQSLDITLHEPGSCSVQLNKAGQMGTRNYDNLNNKPSINGVTLQGNITSAELNIVSENTKDGWESNPMYVPKRGELCVYTDISMIKIGDGAVPIIDLPYIGSDVTEILERLKAHIENTDAHVSQEDRDRWNDKLNYVANGETLIFTRM